MINYVFYCNILVSNSKSFIENEKNIEYDLHCFNNTKYFNNNLLSQSTSINPSNIEDESYSDDILVSVYQCFIFITRY